MRISTPRISAVQFLTLIVLACTGVLLWGDRRQVGTFVSLGARAGVPTGQPVLVVAFQARDCDANLGFLSVLERPELSTSVAALGLFSGTQAEFDGVIARLNRRYPHVRFELLRPGEARLLSVLGHRETPFWLFLDRSGALVLSEQAPSTPLAYASFAQSIRDRVHVRVAAP